jgi:hypothetical protein
MYKIIRNILSKEECDSIIHEFENLELSKVLKDNISDKNFYNLKGSIVYLKKFNSMLESLYNIKLVPQNTYIRKYTKGDLLPKHVDKSNFYLTLSIQLKKSDDIINPLIVHAEKDHHIILNDGDCGIIENANKIEHSRPPIESEWMYCLFLHYNINDIKNKSVI